MQLPTMEQILHGDSEEVIKEKNRAVKPAPVPEGVVALPGFDNMTRFLKSKQKEVPLPAAEPAAPGEEAPAEPVEAPVQAAAPVDRAALDEKKRQSILEEAEAERVRILKEAAAERQRVLDEATLEAIQMRDTIRQEEEQRAKEESREQIQEIVSVLRQTIREFEKERDSMFELLEQKLMITTIAIADLVFRQEIKYNKEAYAAIIKAALSELESDHASKMYTSPDAYDVIMHEPACAPIVERLNEAGIEIVRDTAVPVGDVLIRSAESTLQYGTATMVKRMTDRILEQLER
ncbi:MAG: FliH/SctL family protein [Eubacteriales bacterium]|nr:FliH/SctL family protein [Eubacteriales bacterium]